MPFEIKIPEQKWEEAVSDADSFVRQNGSNSTTGRPRGHGDEGNNVVDDTDYSYLTPGAGVGASAGLPGSSRFHSRDEGSRLYGHGGDDLVRGFGGNDTLDGGAGRDVLEGGTGHDMLWGGNGNDILYGNDGDDTLGGGHGIDIMYGGRGNDVYFADNAKDWIVEDATAEGGNADKVITTLSSYDLSVYGKGVNVENLQYDGAGNFFGKGNQLDNVIVGSTGNDKLYGLAGNDSLKGGNGADTLEGGSGNDTLEGGRGADAMYGGTGNDAYFVDNAGDKVLESPGIRMPTRSGALGIPVSGGTDTIYTSLEKYDMSAPDKGAGVENLVYTGTRDGARNFQGLGNELANRIVGAAGNDELMGAGGKDSLFGGSGSDRLDGGSDNDLLSGAAGNDTLIGGAGNDVLRGGSGNDTFVFRDHDGHDTIADFTHGSDKINVGGISAVHSFKDLKLTDTSGGVRVDFGDSSVLVRGQTAASMTEADFSFGRDTPLPSITLQSAIADHLGPVIDRVDQAYLAVPNALPATPTPASTLADHHASVASIIEHSGVTQLLG